MVRSKMSKPQESLETIAEGQKFLPKVILLEKAEIVLRTLDIFFLLHSK